MSEPEEIAQEVDEDDSEISAESRNDNMSAFLKYTFEWKCFYNEEYRQEIHENSLHGELRASSFRSVCWQIFLNIFSYSKRNEDKTTKPNSEQNTTGSNSDEDERGSCVEEWSSHITRCRAEYEELKQSLELDPTLSRVDNPLSQNTESVWYKHFCDTELRTVIRQDVVRTFPTLDFFRNNSRIQDLMVCVLFCYARKFPHMCYRQGMHEILAPIIFVLHCDHQALLHAQEVADVDENLKVILNEQYLEHDAFTIFCKVMASIENYYLINDSTPTSSGYFPPSSSNTSSSITDNHVVSQLYYINEHILKPSDPALQVHLYNLKIPLTLFGIRWLRLLFGREFSLQDLLVLWDVIFAEGSQESEAFDLVNYVVVAMMIAIRDQILSADHIECLSYLMRYPPGIDISSIIEHALYLKYPNLYPAYEPGPAPDPNPGPGAPERTPVPVRAKKKPRERKYRFLNLTSRNKLNPDIMDAMPIIEETGLTLGSQSQLAYYRDIMAKCHVTLSRCSSQIESSLNAPSKLQGAPLMTQVLRDIKQACSLLEVVHLSPPRSLASSSTVEFASEAGESRLPTPSSSPLPNTSKPSALRVVASSESKALVKSDSESEDEDLRSYLPPPNSEVDMKTFSCTEMSEEVGRGEFPASHPHCGSEVSGGD